MSIFNEINPGAVENFGMNDVSIPEYDVALATAPLHLPVLHQVTPIGVLASVAGTQWSTTADHIRTWGNVLDHETAFYNPTSRLVAALGAGGQGTIGMRRLSANKVMARVALGAEVYRIEQKDYERDTAGRFKYDADGNRIVVAGKTYPGIDIKIVPLDTTGKEVGNLEVVTRAASGDVPETVVFPLWESLAGVGDAYNQNGFQFGVRDNAINWRTVADFVRKTGVYPYELREFTDLPSGVRSFAQTATNSRETARVTLFDVTLNNIRYNLKNGFGAYTGMTDNRPQRPVPAPFADVFVYDDNLTGLTQLMYSLEKPHNTNLVTSGKPGEQYKQMNPFTCVDHTGAPYYAISRSGVIQWDLTGAVKATGGISPFRDANGNLPDYVTEENIPDPFNLLAGIERPITLKQGWEINNKLMEEDLVTYVASSAQRDVTRNRQSVFWDVGYSQAVKDAAAGFLGARKDIFVFLDATIWTPGEINPLEEVYARGGQLTTTLRLTPESEKWGTQSCRAAVNLVEIRLTGEATGYHFSMNIDLANKFAGFAGSDSGRITVSKSPDHGDNRKVTIGFDPSIVFEDDDVSAENFANGHLTLKPWDWNTQTYRPGLPTVYSNPDSVLKDAMNVVNAISIEKISADQWKRVVGDTTIDRENYASIMKDSIEEECRNAVGGMVQNIVATVSFQEGTLGSRAKLAVRVDAYFNKARYMMEFDLFAYNSQDLASAA